MQIAAIFFGPLMFWPMTELSRSTTRRLRVLPDTNFSTALDMKQLRSLMRLCLICRSSTRRIPCPLPLAKAPSTPSSSPSRAPSTPSSSPSRAPSTPSSSPSRAPSTPSSSPSRAPSTPSSSPSPSDRPRSAREGSVVLGTLQATPGLNCRRLHWCHLYFT